jgi:2-oxoglutarate dehydrogenase E2 component (dihydrolipoamide succinyltransferase)
MRKAIHMPIIEIKVPTVGESVTEATIGRWLKPDGAAVKVNEPILEMETDKATQEVAAPESGVLHITVPDGEKVAIGALVGHIDPNGKPTAAAKETAPPSKAAPAAPTPATVKETAPPSKAAPAATAPAAAPAPEVSLSPAARQVAGDAGLDASTLIGSGRGGRVIKEDVLAKLEQKDAKGQDGTAPPAAGLAPGRETRQRMTPIRQRISERLLAAQQNAAILTTFNEADLSAVIALRTKYKESFQKRHGVGLGFMGFFVKATVEALKAFPAVNAFIDGNDLVYHNYYDIGVAVSTEKGLMVPVLRDADRLSFADVEKSIAALAGKAKDNKIAVADLQGGTFTITNGGVFGSLLSTPILNPPQSGILGMHAIQKRPVAINDQVVIRPMMYLALSYDHRVIDGREAVSFLVRIKECIEAPERLLLDI